VGIFGGGNSGKKLAKQLQSAGVSANFVGDGFRKNPWVLIRLRDYDVIHGLYVRPAVVFSLIVAKILGKTVVIHWMGTEVMRALTETRIKLMALILDKFVDLNLVPSENLQKDLRRIGIDSALLPLPVDSEYFAGNELPPLPDKFSVLSKLVDDSLWGGWLYGSDVILRLAKDLPDVSFLIVPAKDSGPTWLLSRKDEAPNIVFLSWKNNLFEVYKQTTVLLRLTRYDGMSYMVMEALALGRQVIWSCNNLPFCHYVRSYDQVKETLLEIRMNPRLNLEGAEYARKHLSSEYIIKELIKIYNKLVSGDKLLSNETVYR
jgi:glycosyltransferase involved in cell wall biosynthesis